MTKNKKWVICRECSRYVFTKRMIHKKARRLCNRNSLSIKTLSSHIAYCAEKIPENNESVRLSDE